MASGAGNFSGAASERGGGDKLILRPIAREYLADLEQGDVGITAIGVSLRGEGEARQKARAHVGEIGGNGVRKPELRLPAAEQLRLLLRNERPGHRFHEPARGERALG